jgi:acetylornithine deacetylase
MALSDSEILSRLVGFATTSTASNLPLVDFLADYLTAAGARVERQLSAGGDKANLIAWIGPPPDGSRAGLVLCGHTDVVAAPEEGWRHPPFALTEETDRYVGRGACDMKTFVALAVNLAAERARAKPLRAPLALVLTFDEEIGGLGAKWLVEHWPAARSLPARAIIGEPTSLVVARAHKGHLKMRITLHGRPAHSGYPHLGVNAIEPGATVVAALAKLRREFESERHPERDLFPEVPFVALNVATIAGGTAFNVIPDRCVIEVGLRPLPGTSAANLVERVRTTVQAAAAPLVADLEVVSNTPPLLLSEASALHHFLCQLVGQKNSAAVSFATDGGWFQKLGIECAIWGPGSIATAHRANEWIAKSELPTARGLLERAIDRFCGEEA